MTSAHLGVFTLAVALLFGLAACSTKGAANATAFYAEIRVYVEPLHDPHDRLRPDTEQSIIRWWYSGEPRRWRWEIETSGASLDAGTRVMVSDGDSAWEYDDRSREYHQQDPMDLPSGAVVSPTFNAPVGPANAPDIDAFIDRWRQQGGDTDVRRAGEDTMLGRRVEVVEMRPAWRSSSASASAPSGSSGTSTPGPTGEESGGVVRVAIDPERMFVMRWDVDGEAGGQSYRAEVVSLDYGASIEASRFVFDPPADATEIIVDNDGACSGSSGPLGGSTMPAPPGFLSPGYIPAGFKSAGAGSETGPGCRTSTWTLLEQRGDGYLRVHERMRHSLPESLLAWNRVAIDGRDGYRAPSGPVQRLAWQQGRVAVMVESDTLPIEELIDIAKSMR